MRQVPQPRRKPCVSSNCQRCEENEARMCATEKIRPPMLMMVEGW